MRTVWLLHNGVDYQTGDKRTVGVCADDGLVHDLLDHHNERSGREGNLFLHAKEAP